MQVETNQRKKKGWIWVRRLFRLTLLFSVLFMGGIVSLLFYTKAQGPPPIQVPQTTILYGADDTIIGESHRGQNRYWITLDDMAPEVIDATLSIEDRKFYNHYGFDITRIGAAVLTNLRLGTKAQGASTITQQYARNLYLGHDKTWKRKWNEALYALRLEMNYTKDEILEGYLNTIYYGHGAYGIEAAAHHYFSKSASELSLAEASILAGVPKGPRYYSPFFDLERSKQRQRIVLQSMVDSNKISTIQARTAGDEELHFITEREAYEGVVGPYFQDIVQQILAEDYDIDPALIEKGGLHVYTTLDPDMQREAERWVEAELNGEDELQAALVAMSPRTGDVKALIGGRDYSESPFNRATKAKRSPGSTFKPFLYYAALEHGFTASSTLLSEPTTFTFDDGRGKYSPGNFNENYAHDFITMLQALAFSDNIFAVKTHFFLGKEYLVDAAQRFGITSPLEELPSLALGTLPVGVLELVNSYSPFANGGHRVEPRFIRKVVDQHGEVIIEEQPSVTPAVDPKLAFIMTDIMTGMFDRNLSGYTSVTGRSISHLVHRPVAGKSGSTSTDSWMIGYTPQLLSGVWIGYDQGQTLEHQTQGQYAKRIWAQFTENALKDDLKLQFHKPDGVNGVYINPSNGLLATEECPVQRLTYFVEGTEPTEYCQLHGSSDEVVQPKEEEHEKEKFLERFLKWLH
ncbi:transglycosylase domain-containing protein [Bacillus sp. FJAT-45350]|uniref:transglycosylase domain-containing protein n=1 Tax=Bacillus sp. FJAT-45350 TaxID=2011014 RepID=UPI000BB858CB|nr:PBP1A family penicillin-binding protein [Bacillus sp. FJAT-45350]